MVSAAEHSLPAWQFWRSHDSHHWLFLDFALEVCMCPAKCPLPFVVKVTGAAGQMQTMPGGIQGAPSPLPRACMPQVPLEGPTCGARSPCCPWRCMEEDMRSVTVDESVLPLLVIQGYRRGPDFSAHQFTLTRAALHRV